MRLLQLSKNFGDDQFRVSTTSGRKVPERRRLSSFPGVNKTFEGEIGYNIGVVGDREIGYGTSVTIVDGEPILDALPVICHPCAEGHWIVHDLKRYRTDEILRCYFSKLVHRSLICCCSELKTIDRL